MNSNNEVNNFFGNLQYNDGVHYYKIEKNSPEFYRTAITTSDTVFQKIGDSKVTSPMKTGNRSMEIHKTAFFSPVQLKNEGSSKMMYSGDTITFKVNDSQTDGLKLFALDQNQPAFFKAMKDKKVSDYEELIISGKYLSDNENQILRDNKETSVIQLIKNHFPYNDDGKIIPPEKGGVRNSVGVYDRIINAIIMIKYDGKMDGYGAKQLPQSGGLDGSFFHAEFTLNDFASGFKSNGEPNYTKIEQVEFSLGGPPTVARKKKEARRIEIDSIGPPRFSSLDLGSIDSPSKRSRYDLDYDYGYDSFSSPMTTNSITSSDSEPSTPERISFDSPLFKPSSFDSPPSTPGGKRKRKSIKKRKGGSKKTTRNSFTSNTNTFLSELKTTPSNSKKPLPNNSSVHLRLPTKRLKNVFNNLNRTKKETKKETKKGGKKGGSKKSKKTVRFNPTEIKVNHSKVIDLMEKGQLNKNYLNAKGDGTFTIPLKTRKFKKDDPPNVITQSQLRGRENPKGSALKKPLPRPHNYYISYKNTNKNTTNNTSSKYKLDHDDNTPTCIKTNEKACTKINNSKSTNGGKRKTRKNKKF
jgi:hypothetical protein